MKWGISSPFGTMSEKKSTYNNQHSNLNPKLKKQLLDKRKQLLDVDTYKQGILDFDRVKLGQAITLVESTKPAHQEVARQLVDQCLPHSGQSIRLGITGPPGVGKSTFIEALGLHLIEQGHKVAVLAIDPSSQISKGSILGDKTRMEQLSAHEKAFIRPTPAGKSLGGVAQYTRESIILCEAAGFDVLIVETVGVGQSEVAVHALVDCFLLLLQPGAGDELQGIKRGVVEMADLLTVNKADGDRTDLAKKTKQAYRNALHLFPPKESKWTPKVMTCSALQKKGIDQLWLAILEFKAFAQQTKYWAVNRQKQARYWLYESINQELQAAFFQSEAVKDQLEQIEDEVVKGNLSSFSGAKHLIKQFFNSKQK